MSETNEASVQSVVMQDIDSLVETLRIKMEVAKHDYLRVLDLYAHGKSHLSRLDYHQGVLDGLERGWREAVFVQHEMMNRGRSA